MASGIYRLLHFLSSNRANHVNNRSQNGDAKVAHEPSILLIVAGGTIVMKDSDHGLVTSKMFLDECLAPKPVFNDGTPLHTSRVIDEHGVEKDAPSLQLPRYAVGNLYTNRLSGYDPGITDLLTLCRDRSGANVRCTVLEFDPLLDSSTAHSPTWNQLARTVRSNEANFDAFVICHGTDTLAYTSAALSYILMPNLDKTVVLTGAQR